MFVGPSSTTLAQHWTNIGERPVSTVSLNLCDIIIRSRSSITFTQYTRHSRCRHVCGSVLRICVTSYPVLGRGPGAVVKAACLESRKSRVRTPLWDACFKEKKYLFLAHSWRFNIVGGLRDREVACSASDCRPGLECRIACPWQCLLIHLTRFPWPSLAYICTKVT